MHQLDLPCRWRSCDTAHLVDRDGEGDNEDLGRCIAISVVEDSIETSVVLDAGQVADMIAWLGTWLVGAGDQP